MPADKPRSIVERAAERLEQLRRAGVALPSPSVPVVHDVHYRDGVTGARALAARTSAAQPLRLEPEPSREAPKTAEPRPVPPPIVPRRHVEIDLAALTRNGYLTPHSDRSLLGEEFRNVKRPLLAKARGASRIERGNLIMVTSALAGEGKTFSTINLALSIASEFDTSVMLVDADTARPSLLPRLGVSATLGLTDLLQDPSISLNDVLLGTNIRGLTLLPAGAQHPSTTELMASDAMRRLTGQLSQYADRVTLFDSPPLLATSEARVLASMVGQIVAVIEAQKTSQAAVREMLAAVEASAEVSLVLNKARIGRIGYAYGTYGY